ncbi:hypothetical protein YC2023_056923 [Brassica napus]
MLDYINQSYRRKYYVDSARVLLIGSSTIKEAPQETDHHCFLLMLITGSWKNAGGCKDLKISHLLGREERQIRWRIFWLNLEFRSNYPREARKKDLTMDRTFLMEGTVLWNTPQKVVQE